MQCDCSISAAGNGPECSKEKVIVARKEHTCCECGETIKRGQKYVHVRGLWERYWDTYKTCIGCKNIREHLCPRGFIYGELRDRIKDCLGFDYTDLSTYPDGTREVE